MKEAVLYYVELEYWYVCGVRCPIGDFGMECMHSGSLTGKQPERA